MDGGNAQSVVPLILKVRRNRHGLAAGRDILPGDDIIAVRGDDTLLVEAPWDSVMPDRDAAAIAASPHRLL